MSHLPPVPRDGPPPRDAEIEAAAADWVTRVDAGLTKDEQQIFQDWLSGDARHADAFDRFTEAWSVFDRVQERGAASAILDQLAARQRGRKARRVQAGIAAGLAVAAGLFYFQWRAAPPDMVSPVAPLPPVAVVLPPAAPDPIRKLPDGSIVELNAGAEIDVQYTASERRVRLVKGEAFFRVEKHKDWPFYVEANGVVARAVGTAFAVQVQSSAVEVVVQEGIVDVSRTGAASGNQVRVGAGNRVVVPMMRLRPAIANRPGPVAPAAVAVAEPEEMAQPQAMDDEQMDSRLAWRIPRLQFEGMALTEAVGLLNRHNRLQLRIEDAGLGALRYTGIFRSDNPEGFVRMLEETGVVTTERRGAEEIVLRPAR